MTKEFYNLIRDFPEHAEKAMEITTPVPEEYKKFDKIVFVGMGGSGIGGSIMKDRLDGECPVPVISIKDYKIPNYVDLLLE